MKAIELKYERKFSLGNFEMETIGVTMVIEHGEKFGDVLAAARKAVMSSTLALTRPQSNAVKDLNAVLGEKKPNG